MELSLAQLSPGNPGSSVALSYSSSFYSIFTAESSCISVFLPLRASLLTQAGRKLKPKELCLIGFHSAFVIKRRSLAQEDIATEGAAGLQVWGWGSKELFAHSDLQANGVGGLGEEGFVRDLRKRK